MLRRKRQEQHDSPSMTGILLPALLDRADDAISLSRVMHRAVHSRDSDETVSSAGSQKSATPRHDCSGVVFSAACFQYGQTPERLSEATCCMSNTTVGININDISVRHRRCLTLATPGRSKNDGMQVVRSTPWLIARTHEQELPAELADTIVCNAAMCPGVPRMRWQSWLLDSRVLQRRPCSNLPIRRYCRCWYRRTGADMVCSYVKHPYMRWTV